MVPLSLQGLHLHRLFPSVHHLPHGHLRDFASESNPREVSGQEMVTAEHPIPTTLSQSATKYQRHDAR